jgi:signal peptidase II
MNINTLKKHGFTAAIFGIFLAGDILSKWLVEAHIGLYERINIMESFVQLTLIYNKGGVFGIMQGHQFFFMIISLVVLVLLVAFYIFEKNKNIPFLIAMGMVFSGAVGNILDRLLGKPGVVDFVYIGDDRFYRWPAFNVADSAIVIGAILLLVGFYLQERKIRNAQK